MGCLLLALLFISSFNIWQARVYWQNSPEAQKEKEIEMVPDQLEIGRTNKSTELTGEVNLKKRSKRSKKWTVERKQRHSQLMKKHWIEAKQEGRRTEMIEEHKERMRQYWKKYKLEKRTDRNVLFKAHSKFMKRYWNRLRVEDERRFEERCKLLGRCIRQYWTPDLREEHGVSMRRYWQKYKEEGRTERKKTDKAQSEKMKTRWQMQKQGCLTEFKKLGPKPKELRNSCVKQKGLRERMKEYWKWKEKHRMEKEKREEKLKRREMVYRCKVEGIPCKIKTDECWRTCNLDMWLTHLKYAKKYYL